MGNEIRQLERATRFNEHVLKPNFWLLTGSATQVFESQLKPKFWLLTGRAAQVFESPLKPKFWLLTGSAGILPVSRRTRFESALIPGC